MNLDKSLINAFRFFSKHAGYRVGFHAQDALSLARAEMWAQSQPVEYAWHWDDDGDLGDHAYWCANGRRIARAHDGKPVDDKRYMRDCHEVESCILVRPCPDHGIHCRHALVLASLSGIIDADRDYRRVVEAELALEAMSDTGDDERRSDVRRGNLAGNR